MIPCEGMNDLCGDCMKFAEAAAAEFHRNRTETK